MLKLSSNVCDVFPKVLKMSSEVSECKPLGGGEGCEGGDQQVEVHETPGRAMQVEPIKPRLKLPRTKRLKVTCDEPLSRFAFNFNLRSYNLELTVAMIPQLLAGLSPLHSFPDCLLIVYRCTRTRSPPPSPWPGVLYSLTFQLNLTVCL